MLQILPTSLSCSFVTKRFDERYLHYSPKAKVFSESKERTNLDTVAFLLSCFYIWGLQSALLAKERDISADEK